MAIPIRDFKQLDVWQVSMKLAAATYRLAYLLPASERFALALQLRRAAVSIPSNIAEGYARRSAGDYCRFLGFANGSLKEVETQALLAVEVGLCRAEAIREVLDLCRRVGQMLTALINRLRR